MSRLLKLLAILLKSADSRCRTRRGCRSGSTDAHHRSSELVAARMTSKKSGSQEGKSCWGVGAVRSRPALSKPSHAAYSIVQLVKTTWKIGFVPSCCQLSMSSSSLLFGVKCPQLGRGGQARGGRWGVADLQGGHPGSDVQLLNSAIALYA